MQCPPDEALMDAAKETGRQMYTNMPHEERVEKINLMVNINLYFYAFNMIQGGLLTTEHTLPRDR